MKEMVKRKSFIISTILILVLILIGFNIPNILKAINGNDSGNKLLIVDSQNVFGESLQMLKEVDPDHEIEMGQYSYEEIKKKMEHKEIDSAIIIEKIDENTKIRYIVKSKTMMNGVPEKIISTINALYSNMQISKLGLTQEQIESITPNFEYSLTMTDFTYSRRAFSLGR